MNALFYLIKYLYSKHYLFIISIQFLLGITEHNWLDVKDCLETSQEDKIIQKTAHEIFDRYFYFLYGTTIYIHLNKNIYNYKIFNNFFVLKLLHKILFFTKLIFIF